MKGGYCPQCQPKEEAKQKQREKEYDRKRGTSAQRGYGATWRKIRNRKLKIDPLCEECYTDRIEAAILVHHIDENSRNNTPENLKSLCNQCHEKIHGNRRI